MTATQTRPVADVDRYRGSPGVYDEMVAEDGRVRPAYHDIVASLSPLGPDDVRERVDRLASAFSDGGVTTATSRR